PAMALAILKFKGITTALDLYYWPVIFLLSLAGSVIGSYARPATDRATLRSFYRTVRPWGWWKPIHREVVQEDPNFIGNRNFRINAFNIVLGIIGQLCLTLLPMYIILGLHMPLLVNSILLLAIILILKK